MISLLGNGEIPVAGYIGQTTLRRSAGRSAGFAGSRVGATVIFLNCGKVTRGSGPAS